ncbi:MAG TPA: spermidine/putrescine ABC transporter substrate-binding protein [Candidatus Babeliales bacterium]|nr:spermidine/putrescine ABC transporter substrate-binding protein [Candidatus Babeliales bacterium]
MKRASLGLFIQISILCFWMIIILAFLYVGRLTQYIGKGKNINVLVWGQVLDKEFLSDFEKETGIHVNMSYFENNEELFVKLQSSSNHDYDVVMPSDWAAQLMIQNGLIKKLDRNKIQAWDSLYPALCNHYFDPNNDYTIPFYWSLFGLGVDARYWKGNAIPTTWGLIFDERIMPERISTVEDIRELVSIAALYLFGRYEQLAMHEIEQIKSLLLQQKPHVEIYTDSRPEYVLASGVVPVVVSWFGDFLKIMRKFDYIEFIVPKEGAFAVIDSFAITAATKKDDLIYPFINYLFRKDIVKKYVDKFDFFPAVHVEVEYDERFAQLTEPTRELFSNINFFKNVVSKDVLNDVLITLKS